MLEDRLAPATLTDNGALSTAIIIRLDDSVTGESVTVSAGATPNTYNISSTGTITDSLTPGVGSFAGGLLTVDAPGQVTEIDIVDDASLAAPSSLIFANSAAAQYSDLISVQLINSGTPVPITFQGTSTFSAGLDANTNLGTITAAFGSNITSSSGQDIALTTGGTGDIVLGGNVTSGQNLTINAGGSVKSPVGVTTTASGNLTVNATGDIRLRGIVSVAGTTSLAASGSAFGIVLDNATNDFTGAVSLTNIVGSPTSIRDANAIVLGATNTLGLLTVDAGGNITQSAAVTATDASFHSSGGNIDLSTSASNDFGNVSLAVDGATSTISIVDTNDLNLGDVTLGSNGTGAGPFTVTLNGSLGQVSNNGIRTNGNVTVVAGGGVVLDNSPNRIGGTVSLNVGAAEDLGFRNTSPVATLPSLPGAGLTGAALGNVTFIFDNSGIGALPAINIVGELVVREEGPITQAAAINAPGGAEFTVFGNFGITLSASNNFGSAVGLNNPDADATPNSAVVINQNGSLILGDCNLGLGSLAATAAGNISQAGGTSIVQKHGPAGAVTFNVQGVGAQINVGNTDNDFASMPIFQGTSLTTVFVDNANPLASIPSPISSFLPATVNNFTLVFQNAPAVLPTISFVSPTASLSVTALGIVQAASSTLSVANGFFEAGAAPLTLNNNNDFQSITVSNSGPNDVTIHDVNGIDFAGSSVIGSGRLTVTAGGSITGSGTIGRQVGVTVAAPISFSSGGAITLVNIGNQFIGPVSVTTTGVNDANLAATGNVQLGTSATGGAFSVTATGTITQFGGSSLTVGGATTFSSLTQNIVVDNLKNTFTGAVSLQVAGNATLRAAGPLVLDASNVQGALVIRTAGQISQIGAILNQFGPGSSALFDAGANAITLLNNGNDFNQFSAITSGTTVGTGSVQVHDQNAIILDQVRLGAAGTAFGSLAVQSDADNTGSDGGVSQTLAAQLFATNITLGVASGGNVQLDSGLNDFSGTVTLTGTLGDVTLTNAQNVSIAAMTNTAGLATLGVVSLSAGGTISFPASIANLSVLSLTASAAFVTLGNTNVITQLGGGNIQFAGIVTLPNTNTLDATASGGAIVFNGDVNPTSGVNIALADNVGSLQLIGGTWNQGTEDLDISGVGITFTIGGFGIPATFRMDSGTLTLNDGNIQVESQGVFQIGGSASTVVVNSGAGQLTFDFGSTLSVGLGATNDKLIKTGTGDVVIAGDTRLLGNGVAGASSPILQVQGGGLLTPAIASNGFFTNSVNAQGTPVDFLMGSDIVKATYAPDSIRIQQSGTSDTSGAFTVFEPDSDKVVVTAPAAAGLAHAIDASGRIIVALRSANTATTLTVTTTKSVGDGFASLGGIGVSGNGSVTISAATANITGDIRMPGTLTALTVHNMQSGVILAGGSGASTTSITGASFNGVNIDLGAVLNTLTLKEFTALTSTPTISAGKFGTIKITGDAIAGITGDFDANLTSRLGLGTTSVLTSLTVAGDLSGTWDLFGAIGSVTAHTTTNWTLGTSGGSGTHNGHATVGAGALNLGVVSSSNINVFANGTAGTGKITSITAVSWDTGIINAANIGTITTTGSSARGDTGDFSQISLLMSNIGNASSTVMTSLTVKGNMAGDDIEWLDGKVNTITVGLSMTNTSVKGDLGSATGGAIGTLTAGQWTTGALDARSVGTFKVSGNAAALIPGLLSNVAVTLHGTATTTTPTATLGTFTATQVANSSFTIERGSLTTFTVTRSVASTPIQVLEGAGGNIGTITAGDWDSSNVTARTIGTFKTTGAVQTVPSSGLVGNVTNSSIDTFLTGGTTASLGTLSVAGGLDMNGGFIRADNGIGSLTVKRTLANGVIFSTNSSSATIGKIGSITVGKWDSVNVEANNIGAASVTGFTALEAATPNFTFGDLQGSNWSVITGKLASLTTNGSLTSSSILVPFGLPKVTIGRTITSSTIIADNPLTPASGVLGTVTAKLILDATIRASSITSVTTTKGTVFDESGSALSGNVESSSIIATVNGATGPVAIGTLTIAGILAGSQVAALSSITSFKVAEFVSGSDVYAAFGNASAKIGALTAGQWDSTDLAARNVTTFTVVGNAARGIVGSMEGSRINITGNVGGTALGTFSAAGAIMDSTFHISSGNVTSFTVGRMVHSDLLVGVHLPKPSDLSGTPVTWLGTFKIGTFKTTAVLGSDPTTTAGLDDSNVVAGSLGSVTITGVNTVAPATTVKFGLLFRASLGSGPTISVPGLGSISPNGPAHGNFIYLSLP